MHRLHQHGRGALEAIYFKPGEFHYQIKKIEIMKSNSAILTLSETRINKKAVLDGEADAL